MWIVCYADNSHQKQSFIFSEKKKKENTQKCICRQCFKGYPFLIYCTATAHNKINLREIAFYL